MPEFRINIDRFEAIYNFSYLKLSSIFRNILLIYTIRSSFRIGNDNIGLCIHNETINYIFYLAKMMFLI